MARLTHLELTCIAGCSGEDIANFNAAFFVSHNDKQLDTILQRFWELESSETILGQKPYTRDENDALKQVQESTCFNKGRYEVEMPWKEDPRRLPNKYSMAVKRLENTEKRLLKNTDVAESYSKNIKDYQNKGYVSKVDMKSDNEGPSEKSWFLPNFQIVRPDKSAIKVRIVFDASAKHEGMSFNDILHQGPKLQQDLFDVLLRFRQFPVALLYDIAEMYLRIRISSADRPFHRFLWRDLDTSKPPDIYQFNDLVFGVNSCPFQAQFITRKHPENNKE